MVENGKGKHVKDVTQLPVIDDVGELFIVVCCCCNCDCDATNAIADVNDLEVASVVVEANAETDGRAEVE